MELKSADLVSTLQAPGSKGVEIVADLAVSFPMLHLMLQDPKTQRMLEYELSNELQAENLYFLLGTSPKIVVLSYIFIRFKYGLEHIKNSIFPSKS
jgi:hypothetical protein